MWSLTRWMLRLSHRIALLWNRREPESEEDAENPMTTQLQLPWRSLGVKSGKELVVRDVMRRQDLGVYRGSFSTTLAPRAFMLLRLSPRTGKLATWDTWTPAEVNSVCCGHRNLVSPDPDKCCYVCGCGCCCGCRGSSATPRQRKWTNTTLSGRRGWWFSPRCSPC